MNVFAIGLGYSVQHFARENPDLAVSGTTRTPESAAELTAAGFEVSLFSEGWVDAALVATFDKTEVLLVSAAPTEAGDPTLEAMQRTIETAPMLRQVIYLSTVGVYGGADGGWVDESAPTLATSARARWRVAAEQRWLELGARIGAPVDVLRLAGIYGPGRNAIVKLRDRSARRIVKPGQVFNRIHVADIAGAIRRLIDLGGRGGVWNVADHEPAPPQEVIAHAATLIGVEPPPEEPFESAEMTAMARSFYSDNRRVSVEKLARGLGFVWRYPTYREGLRALAAAD